MADYREAGRFPPLTEEQKKLRSILYLSFRYSQGTPHIQLNIFRWLKVGGFLDEFSMENDEIPSTYLGTMPLPRYHARFEEEEDYRETFVLFSRDLWSIRNQPKKALWSSARLERRMLLSTLKVEIDYQYDGRPPGGEKNHAPAQPDSNRDPYRSILRRHTILLADTGYPAYNLLFQNLGGMMYRMRGRRVWHNINELATLWEEHHPGHQFFPDT